MSGRVDIGRHKRAGCKVCSHTQRGQIEQDFLAWKSPIAIAAEYGLEDRSSIYRHAHAFELFDKRRRNVRAALEKIIERAGDVEVNAGAVVQAVAIYAKLNAQGQLVERREQIDLNALFERMTKDELENYAKTGQLPGWFTETVGVASNAEGSSETA